MMIQLLKKEALVIEINQFNTVKPPAVMSQYAYRKGTSETNLDSQASWIYARMTATTDVIIKASLGLPLSSTLASRSGISR